jgi:hypothetical protein
LFGGGVMQYVFWRLQIPHPEAVKAWGVYVEFISVFGAISAGLLAAVRYLVHRDEQLMHDKQKFMSERYDMAKHAHEKILGEVARLAALEAISSPLNKEDAQQFLELFYGPMLEFEDQEISDTMGQIKTNVIGCLNPGSDFTNEKSLDELSRQLRIQCDAYLDRYHSEARYLTCT